MRKQLYRSIILQAFVILFFSSAFAQNPLILHQFTADPSARVFGDSVYVYPSHDIPVVNGHGRPGWFCMEDYHVFSSANLTDWKDHGPVLNQRNVRWADSTSYSMWAPDCIFRNGKYYFYFPTMAKEGSINGKGFTVGVAVSDTPFGPFIPLDEPIKGVHGIDPNVFIDKNGQAFIYWAQGDIFAAKLKSNMTELDSAPQILANLPSKGLKEGPYLFERNGIYYLTYPHVAGKIERLEYATADNPLGPFRFGGLIMDESPSGCWTNHQSIIRLKDQWYLFYHDDQLSPDFDKNRSIRADSLFFEADGTIRKVRQTLRGVGITRAASRIQLDRYSDISHEGVTIDFLDTAKKMEGWKATFRRKDSWIRYNRVNFDGLNCKQFQLRINSKGRSVFRLYLNDLHGPLIGEFVAGKDEQWQILTVKALKKLTGVHDIFIKSTNSAVSSVDWLSCR